MKKIDKDTLKESLTIEDVFNYVAELGGEPHMMNGFFISKTICHNPIGEGSYKLYYYDNTHLFKCYTECDNIGGFDIYELTRKVKNNIGENFSLPKAINYVAAYFGYSNQNFNFEILENDKELCDWEIFKKYEQINSINEQKVDLKCYDNQILKYLPTPHILSWEQEGIKFDIIKKRGICYDPINNGIVIPHYDMDNKLIGIRERTLIKENEVYGKYRPAFLNGVLYNHPLSFNLYNLNNSKNNIKIIKKAIVFEGEKSPLLYASYFGEENDISVACCGSSLIAYQVKLLLSLGVDEIIIAFDKQFQEIGDTEFKKWTKKLTNIHNNYSKYCQISFLFDKNNNLLEYKDSPIDKGKDVFLQMFKERIFL